ncbi:hypothetical protein C8Q70DRAFT_1117474, partial [Cubamyces menziesii]
MARTSGPQHGAELQFMHYSGIDNCFYDTQQLPTPPTTQDAVHVAAADHATSLQVVDLHTPGTHTNGSTSLHAPPLPLARRSYDESHLARHEMGRMAVACPSCAALHWNSEKIKQSSNARPRFGFCCDSGQVSLPPVPEPPEPLRTLFVADSEQAKEFRANIRQYNAAFAFTSLGVSIDDTVNVGRGPYIFRIHGELCHRSGSLLPAQGQPPRYSQLYIYDPRLALEERAQRNSNLRRDTLELLQELLSANHQYAATYRHAFEVLRDAPTDDVFVRLAPVQRTVHQGM